jgi:hypothetical protein
MQLNSFGGAAMSTLVNHAIFLQAPKGVIPDIASERGKDPQTLNKLASFFQAAPAACRPASRATR